MGKPFPSWVDCQKFLMCFIAENAHSQEALVSGLTRSNFANLEISGI